MPLFLLMFLMLARVLLRIWQYADSASSTGRQIGPKDAAPQGTPATAGVPCPRLRVRQLGVYALRPSGEHGVAPSRLAGGFFLPPGHGVSDLRHIKCLFFLHFLKIAKMCRQTIQASGRGSAGPPGGPAARTCRAGAAGPRYRHATACASSPGTDTLRRAAPPRPGPGPGRAAQAAGSQGPAADWHACCVVSRPGRPPAAKYRPQPGIRSLATPFHPLRRAGCAEKARLTWMPEAASPRAASFFAVARHQLITVP